MSTQGTTADTTLPDYDQWYDVGRVERSWT
jgi:hypothetical protein